MQRLTWQLLNGSRRSTIQKFFISFLAQDVSNENSILVEHLGGERMIGLARNTLYKTVGKTKISVEEIRSTHRNRGNVKQQTTDLHKRRYPVSSFNTKFTVFRPDTSNSYEDPTDTENK